MTEETAEVPINLSADIPASAPEQTSPLDRLPPLNLAPMPGTTTALESRVNAIEKTIVDITRDVSPIIPPALEERITALETTLDKVVGVVETIIGPLETLVTDLEHKRIFNVIGDAEQVIKDLPTLMAELAEVKAVVKGI